MFSETECQTEAVVLSRVSAQWMTRTHQLLGTLGINIFFLGALNAWQCVERVEHAEQKFTGLTEYLLHQIIHPHKSSLEYCPVNSLSPQMWQRLQLNLYQPHLSVSSSYVLEQVLEVNWWEFTFNVAAHSRLSRMLSGNQHQHFSSVLQIFLRKGLECFQRKQTVSWYDLTSKQPLNEEATMQEKKSNNWWSIVPVKWEVDVFLDEL